MTMASPDSADGQAAHRRGRAAGDHRAATVAELTAAIARIGPGGQTLSAPGPAGSEGDTVGAPRSRPRPGRVPEERRMPPPDDPAGLGRDDPGDPQSVAKAICLRLLTVRARSRSELAEELRRREIPADVADRVLDRYVEVGLIDDAAFAHALVASKHRDRGLGRAALRTELRRKGISGPLADSAVQSVDEDAERRRAAELVAKKLDSAIFAGLPTARRRLLGLLSRRGYPPSLAAAVVNDALRGYSEPTAVPADFSADLPADGGAEGDGTGREWDAPTP